MMRRTWLLLPLLLLAGCGSTPVSVTVPTTEHKVGAPNAIPYSQKAAANGVPSLNSSVQLVQELRPGAVKEAQIEAGVTEDPLVGHSTHAAFEALKAGGIASGAVTEAKLAAGLLGSEEEKSATTSVVKLNLATHNWFFITVEHETEFEFEGQPSRPMGVTVIWTETGTFKAKFKAVSRWTGGTEPTWAEGSGKENVAEIRLRKNGTAYGV